VQFEWSLDASQAATAQLVQVTVLEEAFLAWILHLTLDRPLFFYGSGWVGALPWNMGVVGLRPLVSLVVGGPYKSSHVPPWQPSAIDCCYHLEDVQHFMDAVHHHAVDLYFLSITSVRLRLLLQLRVFAPFHLLFWWLKRLQFPWFL
jgi:hypothetical protein